MLSIMSMMKREIDTQRILIDDTVPMVRSLILLIFNLNIYPDFNFTIKYSSNTVILLVSLLTSVASNLVIIVCCERIKL